MTTDIINQLINQYTGCITNIQIGSITLGKELFNAIAVISVALLGLNHLLRKNADMVEANIELIKWLVYLDFFYAFITNFPGIYSSVYSAIQQIGNYLGTQAAGKTVDINPANIFHIGVTLSLKILGSNITLNLFRNLLYPLVSVLTAAIILFCFASIGLELILVQVGSQIILAGGIFLLAFSGFQWTRDYAEKYVHTFFHVGIKMIFIYILVGVGVDLAQGWSQVVINAPWNKVIDCDIAVGLSTFIYYKLCTKIPDQAVSWLTGRLSMGFEAAASVSGAVSLPKKTYEIVKHIQEGYIKVKDSAAKIDADRQGDAKAKSVAVQVARMNLEAQGNKMPTTQEIQNEAIKTLGAARKAEWDKKVDDTDGGKLAKNILDAIPKPKKITARKTKEDSADYTI